MFTTQNSLSLLQPEFEILSPFFTGEAWSDGFNKRLICEDEEILNIHLYLSLNLTDHILKILQHQWSQTEKKSNKIHHLYNHCIGF